MTSRPLVLHLVDDTTPGGVTRVLDFLCTNADLARTARHVVQVVPKNASLPNLQADVIVSHLAISWRFLPALISFRARHAGTPIVHVEHSYTEASTALNVPIKARFFALLRTAYALFNQVVAVSPEQADWMTRRKLVSDAALWVIPSAVSLARFRRLDAPKGQVRVFAAIGRLHPQKGFDTVIKAFKEVRGADLELRICGSGPEEAHLRALAAGDARISFCGFADDPGTFLSGADAVVVPSRWEAYGLVALEARAAGRTVLASHVDGLPSSAGETAHLVEAQTPKGWQQAISRVAGKDCSPSDPHRAATAERDFVSRWQDLLETCLQTTRKAA